MNFLNSDALNQGFLCTRAQVDSNRYLTLIPTIHLRKDFDYGLDFPKDAEAMGECVKYAYTVTKYQALEQLAHDPPQKKFLMGWWDDVVTTIEGVHNGAMAPNANFPGLEALEHVAGHVDAAVACLSVAPAHLSRRLLATTREALQQVPADERGANYNRSMLNLLASEEIAAFQLRDTLAAAGKQDVTWVLSLATDLVAAEDVGAVRLWVLGALTEGDSTAETVFAPGSDFAASYLQCQLATLAAAQPLVIREFERARRQHLLPAHAASAKEVGTLDPSFIRATDLCLANTRNLIDSAIMSLSMASTYGLQGVMALAGRALDLLPSFVVMCHALDRTAALKSMHGAMAMITQQQQLQGLSAAGTSPNGTFVELELEVTLLRRRMQVYEEISTNLKSAVAEIVDPVVRQVEEWMRAHGANAAASAPAAAAAVPEEAAAAASAPEPVPPASAGPAAALASAPAAGAVPPAASQPITPAAAPRAPAPEEIDSLVDGMQRCRIEVDAAVFQHVGPAGLAAVPSRTSLNPLFSESEEGFLELRGSLESATREVLVKLHPSPPRAGVLLGRNGASQPKAGPSGPAAPAACPPTASAPAAGRHGGSGAAASPAVSRLGRAQVPGSARGITTRGTRQQAPVTAAPAAAAGRSGSTATPSTASRQPAARRGVASATPTPSRTGAATRSRTKSGTQ